MGSRGRRLAVAIGAAAVGVLLGTSGAEAKILPVDSVAVLTAQPTAGHPVEVVVRFGQNFDLGDYAWENDEVSLFPAARTDATGWPLDRNDRGAPVHLHRVSKGVYLGSFVVAKAGDVVVVDWSSVYAKDDHASGVVTTRSYAAPLRVRIAGAPSAPAPSGSGSISNDQSRLRVAVPIAGVVTATGIGALCLRRRRRPPAST